MIFDELRPQLSDELALALTAWAEARGDSREGHSSVEERIAVMCVVRNRVTDAQHRWPRTYHEVCFQRLQFSCWNDPDAALVALGASALAGNTGDRLFEETRKLAELIVSGILMDRTDGATAYFAPKAMIPDGRIPAWAQDTHRNEKPYLTIGDQHFFRL